MAVARQQTGTVELDEALGAIAGPRREISRRLTSSWSGSSTSRACSWRTPCTRSPSRCAPSSRARGSGSMLCPRGGGPTRRWPRRCGRRRSALGRRRAAAAGAGERRCRRRGRADAAALRLRRAAARAGPGDRGRGRARDRRAFSPCGRGRGSCRTRSSSPAMRSQPQPTRRRRPSRSPCSQPRRPARAHRPALAVRRRYEEVLAAIARPQAARSRASPLPCTRLDVPATRSRWKRFPDGAVATLQLGEPPARRAPARPRRRAPPG